MKAIYASKLYKGSKRKDKIRSALSDPLNLELVTQLRSYLDDEDLSKISKDEEKKTDKSETDETESRNDGASMEPSGNSGGGSGYNGGSGSDDSLLDIIKDDDLGTMPDDDDSSSTTSEESDNEPSNDEVSESVEISGVDSTEIVDDEFKVSDIQKELNSTSTTDGVRRVSTKGSEVWIYYNDDVNLNNIMEPVISKLDKLDDKILEFNRLARTENAIVFQIDGDKS